MTVRIEPKHLTFALAFVMGSALGCAPIDGDLEPAADAGVEVRDDELVGARRRPRAAAIRDVAAALGLSNGVLLAGIAQVESGLSHCWSEATWACQGPHSAFCGGPVIAGSADGPCSARQGGLGMFQFDGGDHDQTLIRDGACILELDGNIAHAVDFVTRIVMREIDGVETPDEALAWMDDIEVRAGDPRFTEWTDLLACRYNGRCGSVTQAAKYRDATLELLTEFGASFWEAADPAAGCGDEVLACGG